MTNTKPANKISFHAVRLSAVEAADLEAIIVAMTDPVTRPNVSISDAFRVALRVAASTMAPSVSAVGV